MRETEIRLNWRRDGDYLETRREEQGDRGKTEEEKLGEESGKGTE